MGQRLLNSEIDTRIDIKLDKSIKWDGVNGLMTFGENNDYPQVIEKLINSSVTAKAAVNIYSKFLTGQGFRNKAINDIVIGKDSRGKEITILSLLRQTSNSCGYHNGYYWHLNLNMDGVLNEIHLKPFKDCRFAKPDDINYSAKILVYDNWTNESYDKYNKKEVVDYYVYNLEPKVLEEQFLNKGGSEKHKGQIYFQFLDNDYFYPLSPFDACYLDLDSESKISLYKNRQLRNGFFEKIVMRVQPAGTEEEKEEFKEQLKAQLGVDGDTIILLEDDLNQDGEINQNGAFRIDTVPSSVNDKLFENWEKSLPNNIRKSVKGIPAILIDYEENRLGNTSGEAITQAVNFYNALTKDDRALISNSFREIFSHHINEELRNNTDWDIEPLKLIDNLGIAYSPVQQNINQDVNQSTGTASN